MTYRFGSLRRSIANTAGQISILRLSANGNFSRELFSEIHRQLCLQLLLQAITGSVDFLVTERPLRRAECQGDRDRFAIDRQPFAGWVCVDTQRLYLCKEFDVCLPNLSFDVSVGQADRADDGDVTYDRGKLRDLLKGGRSSQRPKRVERNLPDEDRLCGIHIAASGRLELAQDADVVLPLQ